MSPNTAITRRRTQLVMLLVSGVVFVVATLLALADTPSALETAIFRPVNEAPDWIERPTWIVMQAGSAAAIVVAALVITAVWRDGRLVIAVMVAGWSAWLMAKLVKDLVGRGRPAAYLDDVIERPEWEGLGYVSGHAAVAFALATVLAPRLTGGWRWGVWVAAVATALLRVYTGAHLPLDVVGGAALGVAIGSVVVLLVSSGRPSSEPADEPAPAEARR